MDRFEYEVMQELWYKDRVYDLIVGYLKNKFGTDWKRIYRIIT